LENGQGFPVIVTMRVTRKLEVETPDMESVMNVMRESVLENFYQGGRPTWEPTAGGRARDLHEFGRLRSSISGSSDATSATVTAGRGLGKYPFVQQFGAQIPITDRMRAFFFARHRAIAVMSGNSGFSKWLAMALTRKNIIRIPASPFMMFQEEDKAKIGKILLGSIFKFTETQAKVKT
jgi:phage gpG-like protein